MSDIAILGFFNEHRYLSNYQFVDVEFEGMKFRSTEHAYMAAKTLDIDLRKQIQKLPNPKDAKAFGRTLQLREDWEDVKFDVMKDLLIQKFAQEPFRTKLLSTGEAYLEETNTWGDIIWGVCKGKGQNNLGRLLMEIRADLKVISKDQL